MVDGLLASESVITRVAGRVPVLVGVKSTFRTQLADAARELPHVELESREYSESEKLKLVNEIVDEVILVSVTVPMVLPVVPTVTVPKLRLVVENAKPPEVPFS